MYATSVIVLLNRETVLSYLNRKYTVHILNWLLNKLGELNKTVGL